MRYFYYTEYLLSDKRAVLNLLRIGQENCLLSCNSYDHVTRLFEQRMVFESPECLEERVDVRFVARTRL